MIFKRASVTSVHIDYNLKIILANSYTQKHTHLTLRAGHKQILSIQKSQGRRIVKEFEKRLQLPGVQQLQDSELQVPILHIINIKLKKKRWPSN